VNNKTKYLELCRKEFSIPVYSQPFWLDSVCGEENWDVFLCENNGNIIASMPYYIKSLWGIPYITQPEFTQILGPWIKYPENIKNEKKLTFDKEIMNELIVQLEKLPVVYFQQNFSYKINNWLPFYWNGYKQTTNYTYRIEGISDFDKLFKEFHISKKRNIIHANTYNLLIDYDMSARDFYDYHKSTLKKLGKRIYYEFSVFERIATYAISNNSGRIIKIIDKNENIHGAIFIIWDRMNSYNVMTSFDPDFRYSRGSSLLFYETIKYVSRYVDCFDFEGSMVESIENSYRKFGTVQTPYFKIWKTYTRNPVLKFFINTVKDIR
jgi:hypothetical protein